MQDCYATYTRSTTCYMLYLVLQRYKQIEQYIPGTCRRVGDYILLLLSMSCRCSIYIFLFSSHRPPDGWLFVKKAKACTLHDILPVPRACLYHLLVLYKVTTAGHHYYQSVEKVLLHACSGCFRRLAKCNNS